MELPRWKIDLNAIVNMAMKQVLDDTTIENVSIREWIKRITSGRYQPVKYGRREVNGDRCYLFCSNCKNEPPSELIRCNALSLEPILTKYCPNCGSENGTRIYKGGNNNG